VEIEGKLGLRKGLVESENFSVTYASVLQKMILRSSQKSL